MIISAPSPAPHNSSLYHVHWIYSNKPCTYGWVVSAWHILKGRDVIIHHLVVQLSKKKWLICRLNVFMLGLCFLQFNNEVRLPEGRFHHKIIIAAEVGFRYQHDVSSFVFTLDSVSLYCATWNSSTGPWTHSVKEQEHILPWMCWLVCPSSKSWSSGSPAGSECQGTLCWVSLLQMTVCYGGNNSSFHDARPLHLFLSHFRVCLVSANEWLIFLRLIHFFSVYPYRTVSHAIILLL